MPYVRNARTHSESQLEKLTAYIKTVGFLDPIEIDENDLILAGHARQAAALKLGMKTVPCVVHRGLSDENKKGYILANNRLAEDAGWSNDMLKLELSDLRDAGYEMGLLGWNDDELDAIYKFGDDLSEGLGAAEAARSLQERFGAVPFSVLNARDGWWQERKRAWLAKGIQSELGRGKENLLGFSEICTRRGGYNASSQQPAASKPQIKSGNGRENLNLTMVHPITTSTPDFYSKKRKVEKELGHKMTTKEAAIILTERGEAFDARAAQKAKRDSTK